MWLWSCETHIWLVVPPAPSAPPVAVRHTQLTSTSVILQWTPPPTENVNGIIRAYTVTVSEHETGRSYNLSSPQTELSIGNLHPFYWYNFSVCTVTIAQGPCTAMHTLQTLEAGKDARCNLITYSYLPIHQQGKTEYAHVKFILQFSAWWSSSEFSSYSHKFISSSVDLGTTSCRSPKWDHSTIHDQCNRIREWGALSVEDY